MEDKLEYIANNYFLLPFEYDLELQELLNIYNENNDKKSKYVQLISDSDISRNRFIYRIFKIIKSYKKNYIFNTSGNIYLKQFPWQPFREMFYNFFDIKNGESLRNKLFRFSKDFREDLAIQNVYISELFSQSKDFQKLSLNTQIIYDAFRMFFLYISKIKNLILIFEDIDNFDDSSLDLLDYLMRTLKNSNILFIISKKEHNNWNPKNVNLKTITLNKISEERSLGIINKLINGNISVDLKDYLLNHSKSNPYYLVEIINFLKENNFLYQENNFLYLTEEAKRNTNIIFSIPDLVLSRINKLNKKEKEVLSVASFFGKNINFEILSTLFPDENIDIYLKKFIGFGFLSENTIGQHKNFQFTHQQIQESLYNRIQSNNKKEIHQKIANVLFEKYTHNLSDIYEIIAFHLENGHSEKDAIYYYFISGIKYRNILDYKTAYKYLNKSLFLAKKILKNEENDVLFHDTPISCLNFQIEEQYLSYEVKIKLNIGIIYYFIAQTLAFNDNKGEEFYLKALSYAKKYNDLQLIFLSKVQLFHKKLFIRDEYLTHYLNEFQQIAKELGNHFYLIYSLIESIHIINIHRDIESYDDLLNRFMLARRILDNKYIDIDKEHKRILNLLWYFLYAAHKRSKLLLDKQSVDEIFDIIKEGEKYLLYDYERMSYYFRAATGPFDKTEHKFLFLNKSKEISMQTNDLLHTAYNLSGIGYLYMEKEDYEKSLDCHIKARQICEDIDNRYELGMVCKNIGELYISLKQYDKAIIELKSSIEYKKEFNSTFIIDNWANIIIPFADLAFAYLKQDNFYESRENIALAKGILPNVGMFSTEIPIFIEFIEFYLDCVDKKDFSYLDKIKENCNKLSNLTPMPIQAKWVLEELSEFAINI